MPQYSQKLSRRPLEGEIVKKPETPGRKIYIGTVNIFAPPLAAKVHGRYRDRHSAHLIFDTILALIIFVLLGVNIWYATRDEVVAIPEPELSLNLPESVLSGQIFEIALEVSNATNQIIRDVDVRLDPPAGFSFTKSAPDPDNDVDLQWSYATLEANATSTVLISGKLFGIAGSQVPISFSVSYGDEYNFATAKRGSVRIAGSSTVLSASAPRQVTGDEQFTVSTRIQNSGTDVFPSSSINLELPEGFILLGSNIPDSDHDGWLVPELEPAAAWELSIRGNFPSLQERNELFRFTHSVSVSSGLVELESAEVSVQQVLPAPEESADVDDILSPDQPTLENLSLASDAVYTSHSGVELGFGPNPPRAGQRTGYRIIWAVGNPGQHVAGAKVEASLPFEVDWAGNGTVTHGSGIVYNSQSRLVTWTVGELEASDSSSSAGFDVIISPTQEDEGKTYLLLNQSTLTTTTTSVIAPGLSTDELVEP